MLTRAGEALKLVGRRVQIVGESAEKHGGTFTALVEAYDFERAKYRLSLDDGRRALLKAKSVRELGGVRDAKSQIQRLADAR